MAVKRYHANFCSVERTAPLEFVNTFACDGGQTVQIVVTAHMAALIIEKYRDVIPREGEEDKFG